jgi:hypothetical protein
MDKVLVSIGENISAILKLNFKLIPSVKENNGGKLL